MRKATWMRRKRKIVRGTRRKEGKDEKGITRTRKKRKVARTRRMRMVARRMRRKRNVARTRRRKRER